MRFLARTLTGTVARIAATILVLAGALPAGANDVSGEEVVRVDLGPDTTRPGPVFEGWGTALAWFANVTGGWPDVERDRLADLFYGPGGLGWTIARYNIGGGAREGAEPLSQPGANVPGFWHRPAGATGTGWWRAEDPAMWDWSADANQRWWLRAIRARVSAPIFEAFSNSPPWFMTVSGEVSGARKATDDNLLPGAEGEFAAYLARVVEELQRRDGVTFRTLSPVNEPNTDYWYAGNRQEGAHWSPAAQARMFEATAAALKARSLATRLAGPDETSSELFLVDWATYSPATRALIGQINVHSYGNTFQTAARDASRASGIPLWMSEVDHPLPGDPEDFDAMPSALAFAEHVVNDLKRLEPVAWVFWQAVESFTARDGAGGSNWGLVKADLRAPAEANHHITVTRKYHAMAQFSRFITPGSRLLPINDPDSVAALTPDGAGMVIVHVNPGLSPRQLVTPAGWQGALIVTDATHEAACMAGSTAPPRSVVTLVLARRTENLPCR
ncbi:glycoside hydrolase [Croceibacterium ferulae]|uniref:glycoside hydrolase n=1 Tax=Croceibacterium ferulae TaxID=1854641 RepID=UPI000EAD305D|nr:glycoside hydrolase [Croceibacterium ferulae]